MPAMRVQRYDYRRRRTSLTSGCLGLMAGCALATVLGLLLLIPALPNIGARLMGFSPVGRTADAFAKVTPAPTPQLQNPSPVRQVVVILGSYGSQTLPGSAETYQFSVGDNGQTAMAHFTEAGIMELCVQMSDLCGNGNEDYRNVRFDLRPSGAVVYADMSVAGMWQTVGVVLRLIGTAPRFEVAGVDLGGTLFAVPPGGLGAAVSDIERSGNDILGQASIQAAGATYRPVEVYIDDATLMLVLR